MLSLPLAADIVLIAVVAVAAVLDLKTRRIPNWLTMSAFGIALLLRIPLGGSALLDGLAAAGIAFLLCLPVFALGGLGGGDLKLLTAVGAFLGVERLWGALLVTVLVGGAFALVAVLRRRRTGETAANMYWILKSLGKRSSYRGWKAESDDDAPPTIRSAGVITQPYGLAIAAGAIYAVLPFV